MGLERTTSTIRRRVDQVRRRSGMLLDQGLAIAQNQFRPPRVVGASDGFRCSIVTVNFSTTDHLLLMLASLADQRRFDLVDRIVIVDNGSRDGGVDSVRALAANVSRVYLIERRRRLHHATGLRAGLRALDELDRGRDHTDVANWVILCDPDVVWIDPDALGVFADQVLGEDAALAGEARGPLESSPDVQASFLMVRRDVFVRRDVAPLVHHGSPTAWLQASAVRTGLRAVDLGTYRSGALVHAGRAGVEAAGRHRPWHPYASVPSNRPHFMGNPIGADLQREARGRFAEVFGPAGLHDLALRLDARPTSDP